MNDQDDLGSVLIPSVAFVSEASRETKTRNKKNLTWFKFLAMKTHCNENLLTYFV
jgi:hypothetical protein